MVSVVLCLSHVYAIADTAFSQSQASSQEQCIIIRYEQIHKLYQFYGISFAKLCFFFLSCLRFKKQMLRSVIHNLDSHIFFFNYKPSYSDHFLQATNECIY